MFNYFKNQKLVKNTVDGLFQQMNQFARNPEFFGEGKVQDDPDGRFELVALFATAIFIGLAKRGEFESKVSQKLFDTIFKTFDQALRELGVSDMKVGARIKIMSESFYGRQNSYINAFNSDDQNLLKRKIALNVLGDENGENSFADILANNFANLVENIRGQNFQ